MKVIRRLWPILYLVALFGLLATPVLAFLYSAPYIIKESSGNSYTMLAVSVNASNTWMSTNGFFETTALDTRVETSGGSVKPHLVTDTKTLTASPVPANSQINLRFTTGNADLTAMDIITGYNGYVTTTDTAALEPSDNFTVEYSGYINTATNLLTSLNATAQTGGTTLYDSVTQRAGERINGFIGTISEVDFYLKKANGVPTGSANVTVRRAVDGQLLGVIGTTTNVTASFTNSYAWYVYNSSSVTITTPTDIRVLFEYFDGDAGNNISLGDATPNTTGVGYFTSQTGIWSDVTAFDASFRIFGSFSTIQDRYILNKTASNVVGLNLYSTPTISGNITSDIITATGGTATSNNATVGAGDTNLFGVSPFGAGERIPNFIGQITEIDWYLKTGLGAPAGTANVTVRRTSDDALLGIVGTINVGTIGGAYAWYTFNSTPVTVSTPTDIRILFEHNGDAGNFITLNNSAHTSTIGEYTAYSGGWSDNSAFDTVYRLFYVPPGVSKEATKGSVTSGEHIIKSVEDSSHFWVSIDGVSSTNETSVAVPNNTSNHVLMSNATPYANYYKYSVAGTELIHYAPNTIISGTALPNLDSGGSYPGVITWGSNPSGVTVTLGSMVSSGQPSLGAPATTTTDTLGTAPVTDWFRTPDVSGTLLSNPLRPFVVVLSDTTSLTERQAWVWLGIALVLFVTVGVGTRVKGHHFITGIACGAAIGLCVQQTVFPFYALTFIAVAVIAGVFAERKRFM